MPDGSHFHSKGVTAIFLAFAGLSFLWFGCGQKGSPRPPRLPQPATVKDLSYSVRNKMVALRWTVAGRNDRTESLPVAVKVFRSKLSADEPGCEKCPIRFVRVGEIPIQISRFEKSGAMAMNFTEALEPGYRYIYKVIVYDEGGRGSQDSNYVSFTH